ncbi:MAG: LysR family transcriptional regulator [Cupriavidus sp.]|nr:LysR family transcriptional regulator [Cupriavidus sp.]
METHQLNAFVKVVQTGSFTKAADLLGTQKAHLSRIISQMEQRLGVRLLERTTRSLSLTEVGREMFERAIGILAAIEDAKHAAQRTLDEPRGVLKLTCGVEFGQLAVSAWINTYLQQYPEVEIEADWTNRVVDLVHEGFDLAIRLGELPDSSLAARKLGDLHYGLYASPAYLQRHGTPSHPQDLHQHDLLMFTGGNAKQGWLLRRANESIRISTQHARYRINNSYAVCNAALAGLGIAKLPRLMTQQLSTRTQLIEVMSSWASPAVVVQAVFPSARFLTPKVRAFIETVHSNFSK